MADIDDILPVLRDDNPILKQISEPVEKFDAELHVLVASMQQTMNAYFGRGLAAVQIGVLKRVLIACADNEVIVMVNPVITRTLKRDSVEMEGCLSIPRDKWRKVSRPAKCEVTWQDVDGNTLSRNCSGDLARVVQHEMDHLDGILITDKPPVR